MMRTLLALIAAFVTFYVVTAMLGNVGIFSLVLALGAAIVVFALGKGKKSGSGSAASGRGRYPEGFKPSFAHKNIAIDTEQEKLWLRDKSGTTAVLGKSQIKEWETGIADGKKGFFVSRSDYPCLNIHVSDLKCPRYMVLFDEHQTGIGQNVFNRNKEERDEWFSRLTTWVNNT